jgi:Protein of unknown function (DUF551)
MKWISLKDEMPRPADEILFTDGYEVFYGWLESYITGEDPLFYKVYSDVDNWPAKISHWMPFPKPPKNK